MLSQVLQALYWAWIQWH